MCVNYVASRFSVIGKSSWVSRPKTKSRSVIYNINTSIDSWKMISKRLPYFGTHHGGFFKLSSVFHCTVIREILMLLKYSLSLSLSLSGHNFEAAVKYLLTNSSLMNSHADTAVSLKISDSLSQPILTQLRPC
jgi:hypothetical protein